MNDNPNIENLKPFKKGQSGNPKGRPKLPDLKAIIEDLGEDNLNQVVDALFKQAKRGNTKAIDIIFDRYYGKVKQDIGLEGEVTTNIINLGDGKNPK